jgi:hypothetical protein
MSMAYVVQAIAPSNHVAISQTVAARDEALTLAVDWEAQGHTRIRIIGDGRIYTAQQLAMAVINRGRPA